MTTTTTGIQAIGLVMVPTSDQDRSIEFYEQLRAIQPTLIMVSITPFGQSGPYRDYKASDLVSLALGGPLWSCGGLTRSSASCFFPNMSKPATPPSFLPK